MNTNIPGAPLSDPRLKILHSSELLGWNDVVVQQRYHAAGEYFFPGSSSHLICVHRGPPVAVQQNRHGQSFRGILASGHIQILPTGGGASSWYLQTNTDDLHVLLTPALLQRVAEEYDQPHSELIESVRTYDPRIETISSALLTELLEDGPSGRLYVEGLSTALAAHLIHAYTSAPHYLPEVTQGLPAAQLQKITALIEERLAEDLGLVELAAAVGLRPSHLSSLFRKTTGLSPHTYIVQRRLERAQYLLRATKLSIGEIATTVGFYDQSHLVRQMRNAMGVTPSYIRNHL
jgi:AraC family transcriptional regulator